MHYMLSKAEVKARPSVLWCYKKELGFSRYKRVTIVYPLVSGARVYGAVLKQSMVYVKMNCGNSNRKKRMRIIKNKIARGLMDPDEDNPFELFISSTNIRYTYYAESHKILGQTFGMLVLQVLI